MGRLVVIEAGYDDVGAGGVVVVGGRVSQHWVKSLAPPLDELSIVQDMLCAMVDTAWKEVLVLGSGEE